MKFTTFVTIEQSGDYRHPSFLQEKGTPRIDGPWYIETGGHEEYVLDHQRREIKGSEYWYSGYDSDSPSGLPCSILFIWSDGEVGICTTDINGNSHRWEFSDEGKWEVRK